MYCIIYNFMGTMGWCAYRRINESGVNRFSLFLRDPNYTGGMALISLFSIYFLNRTKDISSWLYYSLFIFFGICLFNTVSKAAFIVYFLFVLVIIINHLIIYFKTKNKESIKILLLHLLSIAIACLLSYKAVLVGLGRIFKFMDVDKNKLSVLTTKRSEIYLGYLKVIFESPSKTIFGYGVWAPTPPNLIDTHCILLSLLYRDGLFVTLLLIAMYVVAFLKTRQKLNWVNIACSFLVLLMYMSLSINFSVCMYILVFIFILLVGIQEKQDDALLDKDKSDKIGNNNVLIKNKESEA